MNYHNTYVTPVGAICSCGETFAISHRTAGLNWAKQHHRLKHSSESSKIVDVRDVTGFRPRKA